MTTNTRQPTNSQPTNNQRITNRRVGTVLGVLLALQPAAGLAAVDTLAGPDVTSEGQLLAQRGSRAGGGSRSSGSRSSSRSSSGRTGFSNYGGGRQGQARSNSSSRQSNRQSNSTSRQSNRQSTRDSRQTNRNDVVNSRQDGRNSRVDTRQSNRTDRVDNRNDTRRKAVNNWNRYGNGWYSSNRWYNNRPWNYGWYGGSYWNNWGWYPGQAAAWGLASMATFGVINSLVNSAQSNEVSYIVVPDSEYSLYYPSVTATGDTVTFDADNGSSTARYYADCREGTLNGRTPRYANEAQLLNAACQVAFGQ